MNSKIASSLPIIKLVLVFILIKLGYLLFSIQLSQLDYLDQDYSFNIDTYTDIAMRKDAYWYQNISLNNYPLGDYQEDKTRLLDFSKGQSAWAFFPAYPLINRLFMNIFSVGYLSAAFATSLIYSFAAIIGFYVFCNSYWKDQEKAFFTTLVLFVFPFHFYFSMFLSEAPFFTFLIWSCYAIKTKRHLLLSVLLIPLVLSRPNGLVLLLPLFLYYIEERQIPVFQSYNYRESYFGLTIFLPALLVFIAYCEYQKQMTGYYLAFSQAQQGWGKDFMFPLFALFRSGNLNAQITSWYVVIVSLFVLGYGKKLTLSFNVLILISIVLPLTAGSTYSMIRYLSVVFPIFMLLASLLHRLPGKPLILLLLFVGQLFSFYLWLVDHPLGY